MKRDPESARAWEAKTRENAREKAAAARLEPPTRPARGLTQKHRPRPKEGPLSPLEWRLTVWDLDRGRCVQCGQAVRRLGDSWEWQAHHVVPKQRLRREGLHARVWDAANGVVLCRRCHERHELAVRRVSPKNLPGRCRDFAASLGTWGSDLVDRLHSAGDLAARNSGDDDGSTDGRVH